ncbi:MAG: ADP-ribosylation factor-like protein [Candidatus Freyrarchaeum guaymaensis]|nr:ADP-ribosylation factor-like protein [Candidatus Sigynarchaeota archaeon]
MKISLVGLSGCGKTSIYLTTFASKKPEETKGVAPTIMYEIRRHPFLGLEVSIFDFGGQEQYRESYLSDPKVFMETDVLIPVIDLHEPDSFEEAKKYFADIMELFKKNNIKPVVHIFFHKYDVEDYVKELLDTNLEKAKSIFLDLFAEWNPVYHVTSIYEQERLAEIFRDILVASYKSLEKHVETAQKQLSEIPARIIISDTAGNVIVHNVQGVSTGLQLRGDLRDFISACNNLRENFFMSDSAEFTGRGLDGDKEISLHVFKFILAVLIMKTQELDESAKEKIRTLLADMSMFADLVVRAHSET